MQWAGKYYFPLKKVTTFRPAGASRALNQGIICVGGGYTKAHTTRKCSLKKLTYSYC